MAWHSTSRQSRGYGRAWDKMRVRVLRRDCYVCQCSRCKADGVVRPASEVDHVVPRAKGGGDELANLQAINAECHRIKTALDAGRRTTRRQAFDALGNPIPDGD